MNKKEKKISANKIKAITELKTAKPYVITYTIKDEPIEVKILPTISLKDRCQIIADIVANVINEDRYDACSLKMVYEYEILKYFTNINTDTTLENLYAFLRATNIMDAIKEVAGVEVADIYKDAIDIIEFKKSQLLKSSKADELMDGLVGLVDELNHYVSNVKDEDITKIIDAVEKMKNVDEKELVSGILDFEESKKALKENV